MHPVTKQGFLAAGTMLVFMLCMFGGFLLMFIGQTEVYYNGEKVYEQTINQYLLSQLGLERSVFLNQYLGHIVMGTGMVVAVLGVSWLSYLQYVKYPESVAIVRERERAMEREIEAIDKAFFEWRRRQRRRFVELLRDEAST